MSFEAINWAWKQRGLTSTQKLTLLALADRHNPDYGCFPSISKICSDTELSRSTVIRCTQYLQEAGLISKEKAQRKNGSDTSNRYILGFEVGVSAQHPPSVTETPPAVSGGHPHNQVNITSKDNHSYDQILKEGGFDLFWENYPRKIGKGAAKASFVKAVKKTGDGYLIIEKAVAYANHCIKTLKDPKFIPYPATWLNQGRWEDELEERSGFEDLSTQQQMDEIMSGVMGIANGGLLK